jgi:transcriptional regulator with GAF, ATPase, and Fis domain
MTSIIHNSKAMKKICNLIADLAKTDSTVLIQGETGTGKEMIAKAIHLSSRRKDGPLIGLNCAALAEALIESELFGHERGAFTGAVRMRTGRFEQADEGTLFLDEIGDMPLSTQVKLLRVLQEKEFERVGGNETIKVDVRIITATNKDLRHAVRIGQFREDLFYRLNVVFIQVPPLRERLEDLPPLTLHFLQEYKQRYAKEINSIDCEALQLLSAQPWPGNIRELQNVIERSIVLEKGECLTTSTIMSCLQSGAQPEESVALFSEDQPYHQAKDDLLDRFDRDYISNLLKKHCGNITKAALASGLGYRIFYEKMKRLGLSKWQFKKS